MIRSEYAKYCFMLAVALLLSACQGAKDNENDDDDVDRDSLRTEQTVDAEPLTREEEELMLAMPVNEERVDELFDDFIYSFVRSQRIQRSRTDNGLKCDLGFMAGEYCTNLYSSYGEMHLNEDTLLTEASVEKIDLGGRQITEFRFSKEKGKWRLVSQESFGFEASDMCDFLTFYARFTTDSVFQQKSMARSIKISMLNSDDDNQSIEGFIDREQWPTVCEGFPEGVISNIRYGQVYHGRRKMMLEKMGMGGGMSETFTFEKSSGDWKLTRYDN